MSERSPKRQRLDVDRDVEVAVQSGPAVAPPAEQIDQLGSPDTAASGAALLQEHPPAQDPDPDPSCNNILPLPPDVTYPHKWREQAQQRGQPRRHHWQTHDPNQPSGAPPLDAGDSSPRITLLFDLNGTLTTHSSLRRSTGQHDARPGIRHLHRLAPHFRLGIFSSASQKTLKEALALLEPAPGTGSRLFDRALLLHRGHTALAPAAHVAAGGEAWDTVKPLRPHFSRLHRVILVDDDSFKASPGEELNLLLMPQWLGTDRADRAVESLVEVLLQLAEKLGDDPEADVRDHTAAVSHQLWALAARQPAAA